MAHSQWATNSHAAEEPGQGGAWEHHEPCRECAVPPPGAAPTGCPMAAPRLLALTRKKKNNPKKTNKQTPHHQKRALPGSRLSFCHQEEPGLQHNPLPPLVLALKHAFLQHVIYASPGLSREMPVPHQEKHQCCHRVFQLSRDRELPWVTAHLSASTQGRPNPRAAGGCHSVTPVPAGLCSGESGPSVVFQAG